MRVNLKYIRNNKLTTEWVVSPGPYLILERITDVRLGLSVHIVLLRCQIYALRLAPTGGT